MGRTILAWDAPNIDMTLSSLLGRRPEASDRPDMREVLKWLAASGAPGDRVEACVFVNVARDRPQAMQGWVMFLQSIGYRVFAKPKSDGSDIDDAMVEYIDQKAAGSTRVVVASNDAKNFVQPLRDLAATVPVVVLGFVELAGELAGAESWEFLDLEDIPGVIPGRLNRSRLDALPDEGGWFEPRTPPEDVLQELTASPSLAEEEPRQEPSRSA